MRVALVMVLFIFFPLVGFRWNPHALARSAILGAWRNKVAADLCSRRRFGSGPLLDVHGSLQLGNSSHVRERDKALLRCIMVGGVWNGLLLNKIRRLPVPCRLCGAPDGDGHLFGECTFPPLVEIRENPEFHDLIRMDNAHWPRCLLWHGWLPMLSGVHGASPWAASASESAGYLVEAALGRCSSDLLAGWGLPDEFDEAGAASLSGRMVALFLIRLLVCLLLELGFDLLISL